MCLCIFIIGLKNSNLHHTLKQLIEQQLDAPEKQISMEDLIPLLEMDHSSSRGDKLFYQFINNHLQELVETEGILELLTVNNEVHADNDNQSQPMYFNVASSDGNVQFVKGLINNAIMASSPQVNNDHNTST